MPIQLYRGQEPTDVRALQVLINEAAARGGGVDQRLNHNLYAELVALSGRNPLSVRPFLMSLPLSVAQELNSVLLDIGSALRSARRLRATWR